MSVYCGWVVISVSAAWHSCVAAHWSKFHCYKQAMRDMTSAINKLDVSHIIQLGKIDR